MKVELENVKPMDIRNAALRSSQRNLEIKAGSRNRADRKKMYSHKRRL